jgi:hypothetical protein
MATLRWKLVGQVLLAVHARVPPSEHEWQEFIKSCYEIGSRMQRALIFADVALTATQRKQVAEVVDQAKPKSVAVVSSSAVTRGIVTAIGWFTGVHRAFSPLVLPQALRHLGVNTEEKKQLLECTAEFAKELGDPELERLVRRALTQNG